MTMTFQKFGVIGAGAWGTALAQSLAIGGRDVINSRATGRQKGTGRQTCYSLF